MMLVKTFDAKIFTPLFSHLFFCAFRAICVTRFIFLANNPRNDVIGTLVDNDSINPRVAKWSCINE